MFHSALRNKAILMRKSAAKQSDEANKTLANKLGLGSEVRELKLGQSFTNKKSSSFHTLRYDFKPASVDKSKMATVSVGDNHQVTVTVPHMDGAGTPETIFKGCHRPYQKECVLIFDRNTGEVTLEKLTHNIQVKKTRTEQKHHKTPLPTFPANFKATTLKQASRNAHGSKRKVTHGKNHSGAQAQKMASSLSTVIPQHSPLQASPSYPQKKSPLAATASVTSPDNAIDMPTKSPVGADMPLNFLDSEKTSDIYMSESSSESTDDSDADHQEKPKMSFPSSYNDNGSLNGKYTPVEKLLSEDLQLSDSGSDD